MSYSVLWYTQTWSMEVYENIMALTSWLVYLESFCSTGRKRLFNQVPAPKTEPVKNTGWLSHWLVASCGSDWFWVKDLPINKLLNSAPILGTRSGTTRAHLGFCHRGQAPGAFFLEMPWCPQRHQLQVVIWCDTVIWFFPSRGGDIQSHGRNSCALHWSVH